LTRPACLPARMQTVARRKAAELSQADPKLRFRFGFHAAPSLRQLHMHVISQVRGEGWQRCCCCLLMPSLHTCC